MNSYWHVNDLRKFQNIMVHQLQGDLKYLCCLNCQSSILGYQVISQPDQIYISCDRVKLENELDMDEEAEGEQDYGDEANDYGREEQQYQQQLQQQQYEQQMQMHEGYPPGEYDEQQMQQMQMEMDVGGPEEGEQYDEQQYAEAMEQQ